MEASAIHAPAALGRFPLGGGLLRLRSDEQLIAAFRSGNDEAFRVLHDRYRQRLFAYVRQMLSSCSRQDAEDVLQDVFVRAYGALRNDNREMNARAWLYRVAHNRCIDHLRRPIPPAAEIFEVSRKPLLDPVEEAQRRDDLRQLVADVGQLPEQQRSALLMREIDGMTYADLANALDVTVPAVKSLLVRARVGLVEAAEARDADCVEIQADLLRAYDRGVKASGRARKHMRSCSNCTEYRGALRGMRRSFAALSPIGVGPLAFAAKLIGLGGSGAAAAGGGSAAVAGGGAAATATACKVAAVVCTAALATGGAVEVNHKIQQRTPAAPVPAKTVKAHSARTAPAAAAPVVARAGGKPQVVTFAPSRPAKAAPVAKREHKTAAAKHKHKVPAVAAPIALQDDPAPAIADDPQVETGGARAPDAPATPTPIATASPAPIAPTADQAQPTPAPAAAGSEQTAPATGGGTEAPAPTDAPPPPPTG
jgi:RNA polymerase sigma factor (sigma-70 family)